MRFVTSTMVNTGNCAVISYAFGRLWSSSAAQFFILFNRIMDSNEIDTDDTEYNEDIYPYLEVNLGPADIRPYMFEPALCVAQRQSGYDSDSSGSESEIKDTNPERIGNTDW